MFGFENITIIATIVYHITFYSIIYIIVIRNVIQNNLKNFTQLYPTTIDTFKTKQYKTEQHND